MPTSQVTNPLTSLNCPVTWEPTEQTESEMGLEPLCQDAPRSEDPCLPLRPRLLFLLATLSACSCFPGPRRECASEARKGASVTIISHEAPSPQQQPDRRKPRSTAG